jgi:hypothetical protein
MSHHRRRPLDLVDWVLHRFSWPSADHPKGFGSQGSGRVPDSRLGNGIHEVTGTVEAYTRLSVLVPRLCNR